MVELSLFFFLLVQWPHHIFPEKCMEIIIVQNAVGQELKGSMHKEFKNKQINKQLMPGAKLWLLFLPFKNTHF